MCTRLLAATLLVVLAWPATQAAAADPPPNLVIVFVDDLGYGDIGPFGHPTIATPHLDEMAREGTRFTDFYAAAAVCTPSRAALLTGRYPVRSGMVQGPMPRGVLFPDDDIGLPRDEITIAEVLKARGYATMAIGKWHLGHLPEYLPTAQGFDGYFGIPYSNDMDYVPAAGDRAEYWNVPLMRDTAIVERPAEQHTLTKRYTEEALRFIGENSDRPFFLYLAHSMPHVPLFASDDFEGRSSRGPYGDVVEELDWSVGRIIDTLRKHGIARRTLVVFTSDNGPWLSQGEDGGSAGLLRDGKGTTWEGGLRVPTIAWWPGTVPGGRTSQALTSTLDLLPTAAAMAGARLPERTLDGYDLLPTLRGEAGSPRDFFVYYRDADIYAARLGPWKAHFTTRTAYPAGPREVHDPPLLYHLGHDPGEQYDVAGGHPEIIGKIHARVAAHEQGIRSGAELVRFEATSGVFELDPQTLALRAVTAGGMAVPAAGPALAGGRVAGVTGDTERRWVIETDGNTFSVTARVDGDLLDVAITADCNGRLRWPVSDGSAAAYALPIFGEGKYVPAGDPLWLEFLTERADRHDAPGLSLPIVTGLREGASLTWIFDPPYGTELVFANEGDRLVTALEHEFGPLEPDATYHVRFHLGPADPVAGAKRYRELLRDDGRFRSLGDKTAENPDVARLAGAPHIYLWERGPLKSGDIRDWPGFLERFADRQRVEGTLAARIPGRLPSVGSGAERYVSRFDRLESVRTLNAGLREAVTVPANRPLPGGHDPAAERDWIRAVRQALLDEYPGLFAPPERWGGGLSLDIVEALQGAGIERAWLGAENWLDVLWHPEAAAAAREAGYLLGVYDSYGSAHPEDLAETWDTAQMGDEIYEDAAYRREDGSRVTGFANRGVYVNPAAVADYARARISAVAESAGLETYFLDVDATGEDFEDFTTGRLTSRREVAEALRARLAYASETLGLVTGSEGGVSQFAHEIHYAHGMTTVPFKWTSPAMKQRGDDRYFVGGYWPPEAPDIFFKTTQLPDEQRRLFFAPEYRLPLYQVALHDSVVTSHHWEYPTSKFAGERDRTELVHMLYMVPPLYHLSTTTLHRDLPRIAAFTKRFAPLHAGLWDEPMTAFRFLSDDRLVQQTEFADGATITANFDDAPRKLADGRTLGATSVRVDGVGD